MAQLNDKDIEIIRSLNLSHNDILELLKYEAQVEVDAYIKKLEATHENAWKQK